MTVCSSEQAGRVSDMPSVSAWGDGRRVRVGLLGGSFNPIHEGHVKLAHWALAHLQLDQVWLMVSPGNPMKPAADMAPLCERLACAKTFVRDRRIIVTAVEAQLGTRYTADTLRLLKKRFPHTQFVWLMGADIMAQLPDWRRWDVLMSGVPVAVLPRPSYNRQALGGRIASRFRRQRLPSRQAAALVSKAGNAWSFFIAPQTAVSSTMLRHQLRPGGVFDS